MKLTRVLVGLSLAIVAVGGALAACKGDEDTGDSSSSSSSSGSGTSSSSSGNIIGSNDSGGTGDGACSTNIITIDDSRATAGSSGGTACTKDDDCTVRLAGDYCQCPDTPRPLLKSRAGEIDESLNGLKCTCPPPDCDPLPFTWQPACQDSRCVVVFLDGGS